MENPSFLLLNVDEWPRDLPRTGKGFLETTLKIPVQGNFFKGIFNWSDAALSKMGEGDFFYGEWNFSGKHGAHVYLRDKSRRCICILVQILKKQIS